MPGGSPEQQSTDEAFALADKYFDALTEQAEQRVLHDPLTALTGHVHGDVFWGDDRSLEGYRVSTFTPRNHYEREDFMKLGFDEEAQREGIWTIRDEQRYYDPFESRWMESRTVAPTFAHYNARSGDWQVVRPNQDTADESNWVELWLPGSKLSEVEKAVIARIAHETEMLVDVAKTLGDDDRPYGVYHHLKEMLRAKAEIHVSGELGIRIMEAMLQPVKSADPVIREFYGYGILSVSNPRVRTQLLEPRFDGKACPPYEATQESLSRLAPIT
jgi:hypothetical protein